MAENLTHIAELMRKGSKLIPQAHGTYFRFEDDTDTDLVTSACALGTVVYAHNPKYAAKDDIQIEDVLAELFGYSSSHMLWFGTAGPDKVMYLSPETGDKDSIVDIIIELNDRHEWARERIADWLDEQAKKTV